MGDLEAEETEVAWAGNVEQVGFETLKMLENELLVAGE